MPYTYGPESALAGVEMPVLRRDGLRTPPTRYRGASLISICAPMGPYSKIMPRALWRFYGGAQFLPTPNLYTQMLMSEAPL